MNQKLEMNASQNKKIKFEELGLKNYLEAFEYQQSLMDEIIAIKTKNRENEDQEPGTTPNYLLFVEHPHVYTLGKSGDEHNMLANESKLKEIDAVVWPVHQRFPRRLSRTGERSPDSVRSIRSR